MDATATTPSTTHRRNAYKIVASVAIAGTAAAIAGLGTFGTFTSTTTPTATTIQDGTVSLNLAAGDGSASVPLSFSVSPGSSTTKMINLIDDGSAAVKSIDLATVATSSSILDTDPVNGLQMQVDDCSVAWAADGTCPGVQRAVLASGPAVRTVTLANPFGLAAGVTDHLAISIGLPASAGDAFKSQSSGLSLTFTATQRDGAPR